MTIETIIGVKLSSVIAGLIGGVLSISFMPNLTPLKAFLTVLTGAASAGYLTPIAQAYLEMDGPFENGFAFIIGFLAMNLLAGVFKLSERFKVNPEKYVSGLGAKDD